MDRPLAETDWIQYEIAEKLIQLETDPEDRPFQSKYEARDLLTLMQRKLFSFMDEHGAMAVEKKLILESALATLSYELSQNYYATDERPEAEKMAKETLERIERLQSEHSDDWTVALISAAIILRNSLGCIYCERAESEKAIEVLREAEELYKECISLKSSRCDLQPPWELKRPIRWVCGVLENINDPISTKDDPWGTFEQLHTYTLYYLAQAYKLHGDFSLSAEYCQETLARQLRTGNYDPVEWSANAATLSVYYVSKGTTKAFMRARHCLAAASALLSPKDDQIGDRYRRTLADIDRCWASYGIAVLEVSQRHKSSPDHSDADASADINEKEDDIPEKEISAGDDFSTYLGTHCSQRMTQLERELPCELVTTFQEAREVFMKVQRFVTSSQSFYTLTDHATDHAELVQDSSRAYKVLAFFEREIDRKCKMHKRRIDSLVAVYKELNPTYYLAIRRQIAFELGEIYNDMLDLKIEVANESGVPSTHQIAKINALATSGIKYFQEFVNSFDKPEAEEGKQALKSKYESTDVRSIVLAHFYCARLFSKLLTGDVKEKLVNCDASLREYRWVVDYIDRVDQSARECVQSEYEICKDMVGLLPMKMDRIRESRR